MRAMFPLFLATTLLAAGCVTTPEEVEGAAEEVLAADAAATAAEVPFTFDGSIGPILFACPLVTCAGEAMGERYTDLDIDGTLTGTNLTMTWDAASPLVAELRFGISWGEDSYESVEGASPLVLSLDGLNITADDEPYLWTWVASVDPMGMVYLASPQSFTIEGTLVTVATTEAVEPAE